MYQRVFDLGWSALSYEEALRRMFVLGVATGLGHPDPDEYDRLRQQASTSYARSVLELSFEEGRQRAERRTASEDAPEEVWESLVEEAEEPTESLADSRDSRLKAGVPEAVSRAPFLDLDHDDLALLRVPDLLRWEE
ncbi:MAG: hypothetical protein ABEJ28_03645 [Salinigranum sp.]